MKASQMIFCPVCGYEFLPTNQACESCPLHQGCTLTCCPSCGNTTVDPNQSKLAALASKILARWAKPTPNKADTEVYRSQAQNGTSNSLADISPGSRIQIKSFGEGLPSSRRVQLSAYGLAPGSWVEVIQHSPVTIIHIDNTELALERHLAKEILCQL